MAELIANENRENITKINNKINRIKVVLVMNDHAHLFFRSTQKHLGALNAEYEKLRQLRLDQCSSLKLQWETYQHEQKNNRRKDVEKRQAEFDKELKLMDKESRKDWKIQKMRKEKKKEICTLLIDKLTNDITIETRATAVNDENESIVICHVHDRDPIDTSLVIIPHHLLELFWSIEVDIPIMKSEIPNTINTLQKLVSET
ncbi:hypothetical protein BDB01DRAFT_792275 [Pilobolus umbonatus]|nr:hypothetical protein BDB01DRAFT_792275 [Pilobolus umbonatus]